MRSNIMSIKEQDFIKSSITSGLSRINIIFKQILPNVVGLILVNATFSVAMAILIESSLSFLGLGITAPTPNWGNMLADAQVQSELIRLGQIQRLFSALQTLCTPFLGGGPPGLPALFYKILPRC